MIEENVRKIRECIPKDVVIVAAAKSRTVEEVQKVIEAGITIIGENYIQEAEKKIEVIKNQAEWHFIGHLQKNKVKKAVKLFDVIQTLDSPELARLIDRECGKIGKVMPVMIEVNIACESQKNGVYPEEVEKLVKDVLELKNIKLIGLMTMGPLLEDPQDIRPFFRKTKEIFDRIKSKYADALEWKYLSMGMSETYRIAIEEGANMVRIGTAIFGPRG